MRGNEPETVCSPFSLENKILHIVIGSDGDTIFFITAYYPNTDKFEADLKTRKGKY